MVTGEEGAGCVVDDLERGGEEGGKYVDVGVVSDGEVDAIVMWYDLWLDKEGGLSTSPLSQDDAPLSLGLRLTACWEQVHL